MFQPNSFSSYIWQGILNQTELNQQLLSQQQTDRFAIALVPDPETHMYLHLYMKTLNAKQILTIMLMTSWFILFT